MANSRKANSSPGEITTAQLLVLQHFRVYVDKNRISPALADLAASCQVSKPTISDHLRLLVDHGCLEVTSARYRPWLLTAAGRRLTTAEGAKKPSGAVTA